MTLPTGSYIKGYELREKLGQGGFGEVYRAFQNVVNREVAVKVILPAFANDPEFIRNFEAEAQIIARLEHPFIIPLFDFWREPDSAYLVMRYLRGGSLRTRLKQGRLAIDEALRLIDNITAALAFAHRCGVIHRDLKPDNILLDEDGNAYLSDFGIARKAGLRLTSENVSGSLAYISPDQLRNDPPTPQSDIYSLGIMCYEILTGKHPYGDASTWQLVTLHMNEPLPDVAEASADLPDEVNHVLQTATDKNPQNRYSDARELWVELQRAFRKDVITIADEWDDAEVINPYKGLRAFQEADAADFFGREVLVGQLLDELAVQHPYERFLAVVGPSGSGKSSVVRAGLVPQLRAGALSGSKNWFVVDFVPGTSPLRQLEAALLSVATRPPSRLYEMLRADIGGLAWAAERVLADVDGDLVLIIDQFEELFTLLQDDAERVHFMDLIRTAVTAPDSRVRVIITLRADFTDRPLEYASFGELMRTRTEFVLPLSAEEIERAITGPAHRVGLQVDTDLIAAIIADVSEEPGALPLLQYALTEVFARRTGRRLTLSAYQESGGVLGALARRAEEVFVQLDEPQQRGARQMLLRMVTLGEGTEDTRRRASRTELSQVIEDPQLLQSVLDAFGAPRLLSFDVDPGTRDPMIEVAHEALIREWQRLRTWLDNSRADVRLQRVLAAEAAEWLQARQDPSFLLSGARLAQYEEWQQSTDIALTQNERTYLQASIDERSRRDAAEQERRKREEEIAERATTYEARARQLRRAAVLLAVVIALAIAAAIGLSIQVVNTQSEVASGQTQIAGVAPTLDSANTQIAGVEPTLVAANQQIESASTQIANANSQVENAQVQIATATAQISTAQAQIAGVEPTLAAADRQINAANQQIAIGQTEVAGFAPTLASASTQVAGVQPTLAAAEERIIAAYTQIADANLRIAVAYTEVAGMQPTLSAADQQINAANTQVAGAEPTLAAAGERISAANTQVAAGQTEVAGFAPTLSSANTQVAGVEPTLAAANQQVNAANTQIADANQQIAIADTEIAGVAPTLAAADQQIFAANTQVAGVAPTLAAADQQIIAANQQISAGQTEVAGFAPTLSSANTQVAGVAPTLAAANQQINSANTQVAAADQQIYAANTQVAGVQPTLNAADQQISAANTQVAGVQPTLDAANNRIELANTEVSAGATRIAGIEPTLNAANTQIAGVVPTLVAVETEVESQREIADALRLVRSSSQLLEAGNPDLAIALVLNAYRLNARLGEVQRILNDSIPLTVRLSESGSSALFTNDGRWLVLGSASGVQVWDLETRGLLHSMPTPPVSALALSPDDEQLIVGTQTGQIYVFDTRTGLQRFVLTGHQDAITDLDYSPSAREVVSGDRAGVAYLWNVETGQLANQLPEAQGNEIVKVTFNENGSSAYTYSLLYRDASITRPPRIGVFNIGQAGGFRNPPEYRGFSPNGRIAYTGADGTDFLRFFDADSTVEQRMFRLGNASTDYIEPIAFSADGRFILVESEARDYNNERTEYVINGRYVALWEIATGGEIRRFNINVEDPRAWDVTALAFSADGRLALMGGRFNTVNTVTLWDVNTGEELRRFSGHTAPLAEVAFSSDGSYALSRSADGNVRIWDIGRIELNIINRTRIAADTLDAFGISADGNRAYVAVNDRSMTSYDLVTNEEVPNLDVFTGEVILQAFNPAQSQALVVAVDSMVLYDLATTQRIHVFSDVSPATVGAVAFSPDGQYLYYAIGSTVYRWEIATRSVYQVINAGIGSLRLLAPSHNNEFLAVANEREIEVHDLVTNQVVQRFNQSSGTINSLDYSPTGDTVLTANGEPANTVVVWDLQTGLPRYTLIGHRAAVNVARYSPDGLAALSGGDDLELILWDLTSGQPIRTYSGHSAPVRQITFNPQISAAHSISSVLADGIITWRVETISDTVNWVYANRYIREIDCLERLQYGVKPACVGNVIPSPQPTPTSQATATPLPTATPRPTLTPTSTPIPIAIIATDGSLVNVRSGAGAGFALVTQVGNGTVVLVLAVQADIGWAQIQLPDGTVGWVQRGVLRDQ